MFGEHFNHDLMKKYTAVFGTLFNHIRVTRGTDQYFKVPISYGPRAKFLARLEADPDAKRKVAITLPRLAFELVSMNYDPERQLARTNEYVFRDDDNAGRSSYARVFAPVPYDLHYSLSIMSKTLSDGHDILGQILPYFAPSYTVSMHPLDDMDNISHDVPIILDSVSPQDTYESDMISRRALIWTLEFTMKVFFYGPRTNRGLIKLAKVNMYPTTDGEGEFERVTVRPGLTEDGEPTSDIDESVPLSQIDEDDNFGYIVTIEHFDGDEDDAE